MTHFKQRDTKPWNCYESVMLLFFYFTHDKCFNMSVQAMLWPMKHKVLTTDQIISDQIYH